MDLSPTQIDQMGWVAPATAGSHCSDATEKKGGREGGREGGGREEAGNGQHLLFYIRDKSATRSSTVFLAF